MLLGFTGLCYTPYNDPDDPVMILLRTAIEISNRAKEDQKYILALGLHEFGRFNTIDLFSYDMKFHREIIKEKLSVGSDEAINIITNNEFLMPHAFSGGHLQLTIGSYRCWDTSGDYGNDLLGVNVNCLANLVLQEQGLEPLNEEVAKLSKEGREVLNSLLMEISMHRENDDFYEAMWYYFRQISNGKPFGQHIAALAVMKAEALTIRDNSNYLQNLINETCSGGFYQEVFQDLMSENLSKQ